MSTDTPSKTLNKDEWNVFICRGRWGDSWSSLFGEGEMPTTGITKPTGETMTKLYQSLEDYGIIPYLTTDFCRSSFSDYRTMTLGEEDGIPARITKHTEQIDSEPTGTIVITTQFTPPISCLTRVATPSYPPLLSHVTLPNNNVHASTHTLPASQLDCFLTQHYGPTLTLGDEAFTRSMTESYISPGVCPYAWSIAAVYAPKNPAPLTANVSTSITNQTTTSYTGNLPTLTKPRSYTPGKLWAAPTAWRPFTAAPQLEYTNEVWGVCCPRFDGHDYYFKETDKLCHHDGYTEISKIAVPLHVRWNPRTQAIATSSLFYFNTEMGAVRSTMYTTTPNPASAASETITGFVFATMPVQYSSSYNPSKGSSSSTSKGEIIGGVIGGIILLFIISIIIFCYRRGKKKGRTEIQQALAAGYVPAGSAGYGGQTDPDDLPPMYTPNARDDEIPLKNSAKWAPSGTAPVGGSSAVGVAGEGSSSAGGVGNGHNGDFEAKGPTPSYTFAVGGGAN